MTRSLIIRGCGAIAAITAMTCCAFNSRADIVTQHEVPDVVFMSSTSNGSQAFVDIGASTVDYGITNPATAFTIGNLISTGASVGSHTGLTAQLYGPGTSSPAVGSILSFGNAAFGNLSSPSITEHTKFASKRSFYVLGK